MSRDLIEPKPPPPRDSSALPPVSAAFRAVAEPPPRKANTFLALLLERATLEAGAECVRGLLRENAAVHRRCAATAIAKVRGVEILIFELRRAI